MASPLLNEQMIIETLSLPVSSDTADTLCVAAMLSVLDGYDRKMTRDEYGVIVDSTCKFHEMIGRMVIVNLLRGLIGSIDPKASERLAQASLDLTAGAEMLRKQILSKMQLLIQCPWDEDKIH
jgi:hypothetical protein